jgi:hypothetical protein
MASADGPMTEEELEQAREGIREHFEEVREALAEDLGGEPEDYRYEGAATDSDSSSE